MINFGIFNNERQVASLDIDQISRIAKSFDIKPGSQSGITVALSRQGVLFVWPGIVSIMTDHELGCWINNNEDECRPLTFRCDNIPTEYWHQCHTITTLVNPHPRLEAFRG